MNDGHASRFAHPTGRLIAAGVGKIGGHNGQGRNTSPYGSCRVNLM